ncbi:TadE/TadG family type IV pilus assembly protein [Pedococcus sp. KACC 23699]|uniref:TadE/TadG family type IV pilus assembly protein n=1 Tax=Pedococcus sp. KACC 23699 TaxID=3149228 RepID=A0AAU7JVU8_9MICO
MTHRRRARRGDRSDSGASAVEFALVMPVLFLLVFGILDYGRFYFDSVSMRQGVREASRQAIVQQYGSCTTGTVGAKIRCAAVAATDTTMGSTPVVYIPAVSGGWAQGKQLVVCMQSKEQGTGFVPLPAGGILKTKTYMSIEVGNPVVDPTYTSEAAPSGSDWSWCS